MFTTKYTSCNNKIDVQPIEILHVTMLTSKTVISQFDDRTNPASKIDGGYVLVTYNENKNLYVIYNNVKKPHLYADALPCEILDAVYPNISYGEIEALHCKLSGNLKKQFNKRYPWF